MEESNNLKAHYQSSSIYAAIIEIKDGTSSNFIMQFAFFFQAPNEC